MTPAQRASWATTQACDLATLVRDEGVDSISAWLAGHGRHELEALAVALAAMVPLDRPVSELLAWIEGPPRAEPVRLRLKPCGTRAAAERHRVNGQPLCDPCREADREYQRQRQRRVRGTPASAWRVAS